jgi:lipopolysaccharide export system protein LptC
MPVKNQVILVIILLIIVFLAAFVPQYVKVKRLEKELSVARQENALAQLRDLAGLAFVQAGQKNYGLAAGTSKQFFSRTREVANQAPDLIGRKALEDLLASQDKITAELAKGDPEALGDLEVLFEKTRQAAGSIDR